MTNIDRAAYAASLRLWADLIEDRDDIPLPYAADELAFHVHRDLAPALALHDLMARPVVTRDTGTFPVLITGSLLGFRTRVHVHERVALAVGAVPAEPALAPALALLLDADATLAAVSA